LDPLRWGQAFKLLLEERGIPTGRGKVNQHTRASSTVEEAAAELGVLWQTARHRVRQAEVYEALPEALQAGVDAGQLPVPPAERLRQRKQKEADLPRRAARARHAQTPQELWEVRTGDCLEGLAEVQPGSVRLAFTDPPYNIGIDYGEGGKADLLPDDEY